MTTAVNEVRVTPENKKRGVAPWVILGFWFVWLITLATLSAPYWGKSKRNCWSSVTCLK